MLSGYTLHMSVSAAASGVELWSVGGGGLFLSPPRREREGMTRGEKETKETTGVSFTFPHFLLYARMNTNTYEGTQKERGFCSRFALVGRTDGRTNLDISVQIEEGNRMDPA